MLEVVILRFSAQGFYSPDAKPSEKMREYLRDSPETAEILARIESLAVFMKDKLSSLGAKDLMMEAAEDGWVIDFSYQEQAFTCRLIGGEVDDSQYMLSIQTFDARGTASFAKVVEDNILHMDDFSMLSKELI